jgi:23S rRNA pseudouridine2605 synthase
MKEERIQKILSNAGIGSRRACETLIKEGRVTNNGKTVKIGDKANPKKANLKVDGKLINLKKDLIYIALNKPRGVISSTVSDKQYSSILDLVPVKERLYPVGRLDVESEGLVLLTNDGEMTNKLTHPRYGHEKEYRVLVAQHPKKNQLDKWRKGVVLLDGKKASVVSVRIEKPYGKGTWLRVIMTEGKKRQIRETARVLGLSVAKLIRIRISSLNLGPLKPGQWRHLQENEINLLKKPQQK